LENRQKLIANLEARIAVACKREPADLLLKNGRLINVFSGEIYETDLAIKSGFIAAVGSDYNQAEEYIDLKGHYLAPGLIDAHLHIESTLLLPAELARVIVVHGTTCVINDPHEIANVMGVAGVKMMLQASANLPCDFFATVPSCVPATKMETSGAEIDSRQIEELLAYPGVVGLGEMMNYPGVIEADPVVIEKIVVAHQAAQVIDGHAPALGGVGLQAYICSGISSDHECISAPEALEKIRCGMKVIIRHGSASSSLNELMPLVNERNAESFLLGSDDREAADLLDKGHLNDLLKTAVALGVDPLLLLKMATLNPARHYRLYDRGALAPGYRADLVVFEDLKDFKVNLVIKNGRLAARNGEMLIPVEDPILPPQALSSIHLSRVLEEKDFLLTTPQGKTPVIGVVEGELVTEKLIIDPPRSNNGELMADPHNNIHKIAVIERHRNSGRMALALIRGFGLREGALASSVAHDSHNIIVVGVEEKAMAAAVNELVRLGGGFVVVDGRGLVKAELALPVAGLMSREPAAVVAKKMSGLLGAARELGSALPQPFMTLSFMALPVIPSLKITDQGLFDVDRFTFI
jgi:adenine deaminase